MTHAIRKMQRLAKRLLAIKAEHERVTAEAQRTCPHASVLEAPSHRGILFTFLPLRVCQACGLVEEAWTFRILGPGLTVSREVAQKIGHQAVWAP